MHFYICTFHTSKLLPGFNTLVTVRDALVLNLSTVTILIICFSVTTLILCFSMPQLLIIIYFFSPCLVAIGTSGLPLNNFKYALV